MALTGPTARPGIVREAAGPRWKSGLAVGFGRRLRVLMSAFGLALVLGLGAGADLWAFSDGRNGPHCGRCHQTEAGPEIDGPRFGMDAPEPPAADGTDRPPQPESGPKSPPPAPEAPVPVQ